MKQYNDKSEYDEMFKRYESIGFSDKNKVYAKVIKTLDESKKNQKVTNVIKPVFSTVIATIIFLFGGYFLINNIILDDKFNQNYVQGDYTSPVDYQALEQELTDKFGFPFLVPIHETLRIGFVLVHNSVAIDGGITSKPKGAIIAYGLEENLKQDRSGVFYQSLTEMGDILTSTYLEEEDAVVIVSTLDYTGIVFGGEMEIGGESIRYRYVDMGTHQEVNFKVQTNDIDYVFIHKLVDGNTIEDTVTFIEAFLKKVES